MASKGYVRFISLTNNPRLQTLYRSLGFTKTKEPLFQQRQKASPGVAMFLKEL
jgi:ribosomal protein S18 acetylase RimI-like enzyme